MMLPAGIAKLVLLLAIFIKPRSALNRSLAAGSSSKGIITNGSPARRPVMMMMSSKITVADVLRDPKWPDRWPFKPADFSRQDETIDNSFYSEPRLVTHIDDQAIKALTAYYKREIKDGSAVLDVCSSWISHFPSDAKYSRAAGLGMNKFELSKNTQLSEYVVQDLNRDPVFPFADSTFDFVTCVVSVDYLTRPLEVFSEMRRVLKPGGSVVISQSNRCFPTKAINIWLRTNDIEHVFIIGSYFHYATGYTKPAAEDITPKSLFGSDPMYIIRASKA